jgi:hypothetical protein
MKLVTWIAVVALVAAVAYTMGPDLVRYAKMESM